MENQLSEILDNLLGLLLLEGSYEIEENEDGFFVSIETKDAGRLIGVKGEFLESLQLIINQILSQKQKDLAKNGEEGFKRVIIDVAGWRKQKEEDLKKQTAAWGGQVLETKQDMELEPMSAWQRRVVHTVIGEMDGLETESIGEGRDRHVVIRVVQSTQKNSETPEKSEEPGKSGDQKV